MQMRPMPPLQASTAAVRTPLWIPDLNPLSFPRSFLLQSSASAGPPVCFSFSCRNSQKPSKRLAKCYLAELPVYWVEKILQDQTALRASCQQLLLRAARKTQCWWQWTWPLVLLWSQSKTRIITYTKSRPSLRFAEYLSLLSSVQHANQGAYKGARNS